LAENPANKILAPNWRREYLTAIEVGQSADIAISPLALHPAANGIPYPTKAALEIDHARTIGGIPFAP
jgi:hypothetical protein